jgi:hypothetical protein
MVVIKSVQEFHADNHTERGGRFEKQQLVVTRECDNSVPNRSKMNESGCDDEKHNRPRTPNRGADFDDRGKLDRLSKCVRDVHL